MIKVSLNIELDYEIYTDFIDLSVAGANFGKEIKDDHPNITIANYKKYIDDFYIVNQNELEKKKEQINKLLSDKQNKFLWELKKIFDMDFSNDIYQGYLSIFNCNPRWPETKTFQIFYKKDLLYMLEVACHESLHFAFFDYLDKNFSESIKGMDKNSGVLWEMSEIINVIILNLPAFREILELEEKLFYTSLQNKLTEARVLWNNHSNVYDFIQDYLQHIK